MGSEWTQVEEPVRTRGTSWGSPSDRQVLQRVAADVAARAGFKVCALEVLRNDGMLEFVAIHGSPDGAERLLGQGSPLEAMTPVFNCGATCGPLTFVAGEWMTEEAMRQMSTYGHVPHLPPPRFQDAWRAEDMLVARLRAQDGSLRALLYLDEPLDGRRPTSQRLHALGDELELTFTAIVTTVERESFAQRYRLASVAREVIRSSSNQLGVQQLLEVARTQLRDGFHVLDVHVQVFDAPAAPGAGTLRIRHVTPLLLAALEATARRAWSSGTVTIVERDGTWGDEGLDRHHRDVLTGVVAEHGLRSVVVVPVVAGGRLLGYMTLVRGMEHERWVESESTAALEVGEDLGRAILDARAFEKEHRLNEELRRVDEYRTELIATVAHEMKNPIGVVLGHLEMLEDLPTVPAGIQASLGAMGRANARLKGLAEDLLTLSRVGRPEGEVVRQPVDLAALVAETTDLICVVAERDGVTLEVGAPSGEPVVLGNPDDLRHVVTNLVSNAVKYSDPGTTVRVGLERLGSEVVLSVVDQGLGISEADQARLFTEFFRSSDAQARRRPGTGLGLAIVKRVVDRHGGRIEVDSTLGLGTTFRVALPGA